MTCSTEKRSPTSWNGCATSSGEVCSLEFASRPAISRCGPWTRTRVSTQSWRMIFVAGQVETAMYRQCNAGIQLVKVQQRQRPHSGVGKETFLAGAFIDIAGGHPVHGELATADGHRKNPARRRRDGRLGWLRVPE